MGTPTEVLTEARIGDVFGVCAQVSPHPQHKKPLISYFYGYHDSTHNMAETLAERGEGG